MQGAVLIIELEGALNLQKRLDATATHLNLNAENLPIYTVTDPVSLYHQPEWEALLEAIMAEIDDMGTQLRLIVVDTQSRATAGADENSASDAGIIISTIDRIRKKTGAAVLLLHHLPHSAERARGSSAFLGAVDAELIAARDTNTGIGEIKCVKQRNREIPPPVPYKLASIPIGQGPDGQVVTGACAVAAEPLAAPKVKPGTASEQVLTLIQEAGRNGIAKDAARQVYLRSYTGRAESGATSFNRAVKDLAGKSLVTDDGKLLRLVSPDEMSISDLIGAEGHEDSVFH
jgi:hypothetical protein